MDVGDALGVADLVVTLTAHLFGIVVHLGAHVMDVQVLDRQARMQLQRVGVDDACRGELAIREAQQDRPSRIPPAIGVGAAAA